MVGRIRKVVEAPLDHQVIVATAQVGASEQSRLLSARVTNDASAIPVRIENPQEGWPHRESDVIEEFRSRTGQIVNGHDVRCAKEHLGINPKDSPEYVLKPHDKSAPQYSKNFVERLIEAWEEDNQLFVVARERWKTTRYG